MTSAPFHSPRERLLSWLGARDPSTPVTTRETHVSMLAFQGDRVYKLKKAVRYPFVDLSTAERRREDCEREVVLNRRLAPDVYLGVAAIDDDGEREHVVVMRRMPDDRRLAELVLRGEGDDCVQRLALVLARFHRAARTGGDIDAAASRDAVARWWEREIEEMSAFRSMSDAVSDEIRALVAGYLAGRRDLFDVRIAAGRSRDGHGDLLAGDVFCLADGPRVLDCLEFDDRLRYGDVLADIAFLAMDLEHLGRFDLARAFVAAYRAETDDDWPRSLEHFYIAARAHVRAKVAAISSAADRSASLLRLARDHLVAGRMRLVLVGGPPASGKSTLARSLGTSTGWVVLRSDVVRKELAGLAPSAHGSVLVDSGIYSRQWSERTYRELLARASRHLAMGESVIIDASFGDAATRRAAEETATGASAHLVALRCEAPIDLTVTRARERRERGVDVSDAGPDTARVLSARFAPWPAAIAIATIASFDDAARAALRELGPVDLPT